MYCPKCNSKTKVKDSRENRRLRVCLNDKCLTKFNTVEAIEDDQVMIKVTEREYQAFINVMQAAKRSIFLTTSQAGKNYDVN